MGGGWPAWVVVLSLAVLVTVVPGGAGAAPTPTATLTGTVRDADTGAPIEGAWVVVMGAHNFVSVAEAVASESGQFSAEVPGGSYYVYLIDPVGEHRPGFAGDPDLMRVGPGETAVVNATMSPALGAVQGTVTDEVSGLPISGAWVVVLSASGVAERAVRTAGNGTYRVEGLPAGSRRLAFLDPTAAHATEYHDDSADVFGADVLEVVAGTTAVADAALARRTNSPAFLSITGTVTDSASGARVADVLVLALRAGDMRFAGASTTGSTGRYRVTVPSGSYKLAFVDTTGTHAMEWHQNQPFDGVSAAATVASPGAVNAALAPTTGSLRGSVHDEVTGEPVEGAWVVSLGPTGVLRGAITDDSGNFSTTGLPLGSYRAAIVDTAGDLQLQYWDGHADFSTADVFKISAGDPTSIVGNLKASADHAPAGGGDRVVGRLVGPRGRRGAARSQWVQPGDGPPRGSRHVVPTGGGRP